MPTIALEHMGWARRRAIDEYPGNLAHYFQHGRNRFGPCNIVGVRIGAAGPKICDRVRVGQAKLTVQGSSDKKCIFTTKNSGHLARAGIFPAASVDCLGERMLSGGQDGDGARAEWMRSWKVVAASALGIGVSVFHFGTLGLIIEPLEQELHWSRTSITLGLTLTSGTAMLGAPLLGWLIDRFGARRVGLPGMAIYCAALALLSTVSSNIWNWWALWVLLAFGALGVKPAVWTAAVAGLFEKSRGLAMAVALSGAGLFQIALPYVTNQLLTGLGWRLTYLALGFGGAVIALPAMLLFFHDARSAELRAGAVYAVRTTDERAELARGFRSRNFISLMVVSLLAVLVLQTLSVHFVPMVTSGGLSRAEAAAIAGLIGTSSIAGRLTTGYLLDRFDAKIISGCTFLLPGVAALIMLNFDGSQIKAMGIAVATGLGLGAEIDVLAFLTAKYLGMKHFGTYFGTMGGMMAAGLAFGPLLASLTYDTFGDYSIVLAGAVPISIACSLLIISLGVKKGAADSELAASPGKG